MPNVEGVAANRIAFVYFPLHQLCNQCRMKKKILMSGRKLCDCIAFTIFVIKTNKL